MLFLLTILLLPSLSWAADYYVSPNGSNLPCGQCTQSTPCSRTTGMDCAVGSDRVRFLDGTYILPSATGFRSIRNGTSASARLVYESVNPRGAILRFNGNDNAGNKTGDTMIIEHDNIIIRGFNIQCSTGANGSGNNAWDCVQVNGSEAPGGRNEIINVLFENIYAHDSGHQLFGCYLGRNVEVRNSTLDFSAIDSEYGEAVYLTSSVGAGSDKPCHNLDFHHNLVGRFGGNSVDFKSQTRNCIVRDSVFIDKRAQINTGGGGDGDFISQNPNNGTTAAGNITRDTISYRVIPNYIWAATDGHRMDFLNNVIWDYTPVSGSAKQINGAGTDVAGAISSGNIHCPAANNINHGPDHDQGGAPNLINRPYSECTTRINQIIGVPGIASCEIGAVNNTTVVVNLQATKNGPVSSVGTTGQLAVTYNAAAQTENSVTLTSGTQARIVMASAPTSGQTVQVIPAIGAIKNSAFIGGRNCDMPLSTLATDPGGSARTPNKILDGRGLCGANTAATPITCTNNVDTAPGTESLDQAAYRFYASNGNEGANPLAAENTSITSSLGDEFRWRVGVRGGGNNAPSRTYALTSRICNPTCGSWAEVTADFSGTGITFNDDQVLDDGAETTNQLSLGGKTFIAGAFVETPVDTPAVAIASTQQVEWEFSLIIPRDNNPLSVGQRIELRMQHGDGTALPTYTQVPSIMIGAAASGFSGTFGGGVIQ